MATIQESVKEFIGARGKFIALVKKFPPEKREEILFDRWSLKDMLAHMYHWACYQQFVLQILKLGKLSDKVPEPTCIDSVTSFNEMAVELRKGQSWEQVWYRFKLGGEILSLSYSDLPDDLWEKKIWADELMTPEALFLIEIKHYRKHFIEIEEVLRKL